MNNRFLLVGYFVLPVVLGIAMVSPESLWIDEGQTLLFAGQEDLASWWRELLRNTKSEAQMPLGMFFAWVGGKLLGTSEWQLRAANLLWAGLAGLGAGLVGQRFKDPRFYWLLIVHPFFWYYVNEARPYAIQICAGVWLLYFFLRLEQSTRLDSTDIAGLGLVAVVAFATHALFAFVIAGVALSAIRIIFSRRDELRRIHVSAIIASFALLSVIAMYYAWTVIRGAAGARIWAVNAQNLAFSLYELLGFGGLGPPRTILRELARTPGILLRTLLEPGYLIGIGVLLFVYVTLLMASFRLAKERIFRACVVAGTLAGAILYGVAALMRFPFWGRHASGLLPFVVFPVSRVIGQCFSLRWRHVMFAILFLALMASTLRLRFDRDYGKDDYRRAAGLALAASARGLSVWWLADSSLARYYHVAASTNANTGEVRVIEMGANLPTDMVLPDVIILSKPDIFDPGHRIEAHVTQHQYRLIGRAPGFVFWGRLATNDSLLPP